MSLAGVGAMIIQWEEKSSSGESGKIQGQLDQSELNSLCGSPTLTG